MPRTAARHDPDTAALVGYSTTPLTLPAATALLCSLHDPDELADMGLRLVRHITRTTAATQHRDPVVLELSDAPEEAGRCPPAPCADCATSPCAPCAAPPSSISAGLPPGPGPAAPRPCGERFLAQVPGPRTPEDR
ncbi:hypothetical protein [Streptomyces anulatus]|uniref:hypothetical protein n=1 Tax=Streptomyces anulatus TaxID=1892 RepID=UPI00371F04CD